MFKLLSFVEIYVLMVERLYTMFLCLSSDHCFAYVLMFCLQVYVLPTGVCPTYGRMSCHRVSMIPLFSTLYMIYVL